ncbi:hypothetical protein SMITH_235 [Smithella sp. ME-1]|nr:hypothetical protein SMITH_235 [Smithella sp. ME-1]
MPDSFAGWQAVIKIKKINKGSTNIFEHFIYDISSSYYFDIISLIITRQFQRRP